MELFQTWISCVYKFFQIPITIWGYTFTFFDMILFAGLVSILIVIFAKLLGGDVG